MTLLQLRTATRQRADMVNSQFISDSEFNTYINQSYFELYDILVQKYGDNYYVAPPTQFQTDGVTVQYSLPDGVATFVNGTTKANYVAPPVYKLLGADLALANNLSSFATLKPFNFGERNKFAVPNFQAFFGVTNLRYRINGNQFWLTPIAAAGQTIQLWYVPRMTTLDNDTDIIDGVSGWTEYIIIDAAIKARVKEESDVSALMMAKGAIIARIESAAENRDAGNPATIVDTQFGGMWGPMGSGDGGGWGSY